MARSKKEAVIAGIQMTTIDLCLRPKIQANAVAAITGQRMSDQQMKNSLELHKHPDFDLTS
jgi:hypothetical protein